MKRSLALLLWPALLATPLAAQAPLRTLDFPRDSVLFGQLRTFIVARVQPMIADDHFPAPHPFRFAALGSGQSPRWNVLRREVSDAVGGRPTNARDRIRFVVHVYGATVTDTLFEAYVDIGVEQRCGNQWIADSEGHTVRAARAADGSWLPLTKTQTIVADSFGCEVAFVTPEKMPESTMAMARLRREHPCPAELPAWWTAADRSLGQGFRCALVAAAREVAMHPPSAADPTLDFARVVCAGVGAMVFVEREPAIRHFPAEWYVDFVFGAQSLRVSINAVTGRGSTRYVDSERMPPCS